jgi:hypothetical protein
LEICEELKGAFKLTLPVPTAPVEPLLLFASLKAAGTAMFMYFHIVNIGDTLKMGG